jgi:hypothetical protein
MMRAHIRTVAATAIVAAMVASPALGQGKSQDKKKKTSPGTSVLPSAAVTAAEGGRAPFAWIDDASLLAPGAMVVAVSMMRWMGDGVSEAQVPVVDMAVGLTPRVQLALSVPHIMDATATGGASGGLGTTYVSSTVGVLDNAKHGVRLAVLPTLEILGASVVQVDGVNASRVRWGVPVSLEISRGGGRVYGSSGYFSPGVWFAGGGAGFQPAPRIAISGSFSRAWSGAGDVAAPSNMRNDVSGGASYAVTPAISIFGSMGHTVATTIENGAGATLGAGISVVLPASR